MIGKDDFERGIALGYLTATIDGEGGIGIYKGTANKSYHLRVGVTNTAEAMIDWLCREYGGQKLFKERKVARWKDTFTWTLDGYKAYKLLKKVETFLIVKKPQAEIGIRFWYETQRIKRGRGNPRPKVLIGKQEAYYQQMKELNKKGKSVKEKQMNL